LKIDKVQRLARTEPDHVLGMVGQVLARRGVGEDGEAIAVEGDPLSELAEGIARDGELAAAPRVRPHRLSNENARRALRSRSCAAAASALARSTWSGS
jgi:hypothetical protein